MPLEWLDVDRNEEERVLRERVRKFVRQVVDPMFDAANKDLNSTKRILYEKAGEEGILGLALPREYGGGGVNAVMEGIAREEVGKAKIAGTAAPLPLLKSRYVQFATLAPEYLVKKWMPEYVKGKTELGLATTEPGGGSDVSAIKATAVKKGNVYVLNGLKGPISGASTRDSFLVLARTSEGRGTRGLSMFFVEGNLPGFERLTYGSMDPTADLGTCALRNVEIPNDHLLGKEGRGTKPIVGVIDIDRAEIAMGRLGAAMDSLEMTVEYARNRIVWNKPIGVFEGVMFPLVEAITKIESVRSFAYNALRKADLGTTSPKENAMMHWYICEVCLEALDTCIQINGAFGFTELLPHQARYRFGRGGLIGHGSKEINKLTVAREVLGREIYDAALYRTPRPESS